MAEEDDVLAEVEAVEAVYGHDCVVLRRSPPFLRIHLKPRTADDSSKQFVEAVMEIRAGAEYPNGPPEIEVVEAKGLDDKRQTSLLSTVRMKAQELSCCLMLVAVCEEAVEILSNMNHPDGDCPLCLHPLYPDYGRDEGLPFMKLMSCFHCFHSWCIVKWWRWVQEQSETNTMSVVQPFTSIDSDSRTELDVEDKSATCPVCRKVFHAEDIEHVLDLLKNGFLQETVNETEYDEAMELLQSEAEAKRRKEFEAVLRVQEENKGLIEAGKNKVLFQRMFISEPASLSTTATDAVVEQEDMGTTTNHFIEETGHVYPENEAGSSNYEKSNMKNMPRGYPRKKRSTQRSIKQRWIKKEYGPH